MPSRLSTLAAVLIVALLGSVVGPAYLTWRIIGQLDEINVLVEPARLEERRLHVGLAMEAATLGPYLVSGDSALLAEYHAAVARDEERLEALERLVMPLDAKLSIDVAGVRRRIDAWRRRSLSAVTGPITMEGRRAAAASVRAAYDSIFAATERVPPLLATEATRRYDAIRELEELSLVMNAALVVVALAAVLFVIVLTRRERRLAAIVHQRAARDVALRQAAEAFAQAFTVEDVTQQIVRTALEATPARGAFVEHIVPATSDRPADLVVVAAAGAGVPDLGARRSYSGPETERALLLGEPTFVAKESVIIVPLAHTAASIGALHLVGAGTGQNVADAMACARTFGKLATLAYEKVRRLEEARDGRRQLERAMNSRSRLMRGFSHDVKNPLGAADGYADLLELGLYGPLTAGQRESVAHIRRSIHGALALIEDLHELGRAETGNIVVESAVVDLGALVHSIAEDYDASAKARGLTLAVDVVGEIPAFRTDASRVREVVGNLLSNAIKYTPRGLVTLRARRGQPNRPGEAETWALIDVLDTGPGIPAEKIDFIFEEFSRLETNQAGAGVGLAISKLVAEALGGRISVDSQLGHGSSFTLWLPLSHAETVMPMAQRIPALALHDA